MNDINRRDFLKALGATVATPTLLSIFGMAEAAAASNPGDYKALVCINMSGGNDHTNTLVPYVDDTLKYYKEVRGQVALTQEYPLFKLNAMKLPRTPDTGLLYNLHPKLTHFKEAFDASNLAIVQNTGTLLEPDTTRERLKYEPAKYRPRAIGSHNDQQSIWQTGGLESELQPGWAGYLAEGNTGANTNDLFTTIGIGSKHAMLGSEFVTQNVLHWSRIKSFSGISGKGQFYDTEGVGSIIRKMMMTQGDNVFENYVSKTFTTAIKSNDILGDVLAKEMDPANNSLVNQIFTTPAGLENSLKMVAHMINIREKLGVKRQVFMINHLGYDVHSGVLARHGGLLEDLNSAIKKFNETIGNGNGSVNGMNMADKVTLFTFSEMGRSFTNNGDGSDHGWGGHQFVFGGAVKGGNFYGKTPDYRLESENDSGRQGRLIPSTSSEQYIATLAKWFGVSDANMANIAPNIGKFPPADLGFMK